VEILDALSEADEQFPIIYTRQYGQYMVHCKRLMEYAVQEKSDYLYAVAYYYYLQYYVSDNDLDSAIDAALKGVEYQQSAGEYELLARTYNILGFLTQSSGDVSNAVEYLLKSIDVCISYRLDYVHCMAATNLADVFQKSSNYERALYYFEDAEKYLKKGIDEEDGTVLANLVNQYCNKGNCYIELGRIEGANECRDMILKYLGRVESDRFKFPLFQIYAFLAIIEHINGNLEEMEYYIKKAKGDLEGMDNYAICSDEIVHFIRLHMELKRFDEALGYLEYYLAKCRDEKQPFSVYSAFLELRVECADTLGDMEAYLKYSRIFMDIYIEETTKSSEVPFMAERMYSENRKLQNRQYELNMTNEKLLLQAKYDTLTNLPNRSYMNGYADEVLVKACKNHVPFGIEILDIDHFKQINDSYGHLTGDRYLVLLSEALREIADSDDNIFATRYGGDEFVVIYYNKTIEEIEGIMEALKCRVRDIKLPSVGMLGYDYVTISQGCFDRIPKDVNRVWDFFTEADELLYQVKRAGKNNYKTDGIFRTAY
jgi:diguanylate cyclase (GGDEF)-like protein